MRVLFMLTKAVKIHVEPTVIIVATRMDDDVLNSLDPDLRQRDSSIAENGEQVALWMLPLLTKLSDDQPFGPAYLLEIRPPPEFNPQSAKSKLINLNLATDDGPRIDFVTPEDMFGGDNNRGDGGGRQEQLLRFAGFVDLDNNIGVSSSMGCDKSDV